MPKSATIGLTATVGLATIIIAVLTLGFTTVVGRVVAAPAAPLPPQVIQPVASDAPLPQSITPVTFILGPGPAASRTTGNGRATPSGSGPTAASAPTNSSGSGSSGGSGGGGGVGTGVTLPGVPGGTGLTSTVTTVVNTATSLLPIQAPQGAVLGEAQNVVNTAGPTVTTVVNGVNGATGGVLGTDPSPITSTSLPTPTTLPTTVLGLPTCVKVGPISTAPTC